MSVEGTFRLPVLPGTAASCQGGAPTAQTYFQLASDITASSVPAPAAAAARLSAQK